MDNTDYALLHALQSQDDPVWKSELHKTLERQRSHLPMSADVSPQTVSRRIDRLLKDNKVQHTIVSPEKIDRDLMIAYTVTQDGEDAMVEWREGALKDIIRDNLFQEEEEEEQSLGMSSSAVVEMITDKFDIADSGRKVLDGYTIPELITFLNMYYTEKEVVTVFDDNWEKVQILVTDNEELANMLQDRVQRLEQRH